MEKENESEEVSRLTQNYQVYNHLRKGRSITSLTAFSEFGILRLSARIYDLREQGHRIESRWIQVNQKRVKQYWLDNNIVY